MKILILADREDKALWDYYHPDKLKDIDLIISCGDLKSEYLEFLVTVSGKPLLYVKGNHDTYYDIHPPLGCIDIDDFVYTYKGIRFVGFGGCYRYNASKNMYYESDMERRIKKVKPILSLTNGFDILVTHAPCLGYGDQKDLAHKGFNCFNDLLNTYKPKYMCYGHVHQEYGDFKRIINHPSNTILVNGYKSYIIEIDNTDNNMTSYNQLIYNWYMNYKLNKI